jgi:predicted nuclease of predicted toxin-antitoxin system
LKLLLDQNLSHRLVDSLNDLFPESIHVKDVNLERSTDSVVWDYAKENNYIIVSKDSDFHQRSFFHGPPPKVIWINKGNCSTETILTILRTQFDSIEIFSKSKSSFLVLE